MTEGGGDVVVPTLSRTGKGSSVIGRPSRARRTRRPIARPFCAPGCSTVVSTVVEPGQVDAVETGDAHVVGHAQAQGLGGTHDARREQVGLGHDGRRPACRRHVEQQPAGRLPGLDGEVVRLHHRGVGAGERAEPGEPPGGVGVGGPRDVLLGDPPGGGAGARHVPGR